MSAAAVDTISVSQVGTGSVCAALLSPARASEKRRRHRHRACYTKNLLQHAANALPGIVEFAECMRETIEMHACERRTFPMAAPCK
jgi:hypothetical protein